MFPLTKTLLCPSGMSANPAVLMRLVASAHTVAEKAGAIVRKVLHTGELGIVEKVGKIYVWYNLDPH